MEIFFSSTNMVVIVAIGGEINHISPVYIANFCKPTSRYLNQHFRHIVGGLVIFHYQVSLGQSCD